ncbi:winged helix-turn-helix transcriptional regulator [Clostridium estertheticum]|uniref:winged helix-turn-helix transcriptional regulator n=1 Tax=Clostridium estertheticum TaxID=238834 RepID=UPI001CF54662|nr:helix-turn-helix domain-containing protein [Clostridium estertheticum]MCB2357078.1 helix-turn-helix transcriptional regulator [Clostridium estertheticum]WAG43931.1 helix-turn-helix transcriptional regulator [Clostridium estertheticum]
MSIPSPGKPVRGSQSGNPIMALFDLLGRSWAMGVVWNLQNGPCTFRELQGRCESISPSILNCRIKDLREADIVERTLDGYQLTHRGMELIEMMLPFAQWSLVWSEEVFNFTKHSVFKK